MKTPKRFENMSVLITGAGSGIGRAAAEAFAREGACLALFERDENRMAETMRSLLDQGACVLGVGGDVSVASDCNTFVDQALAAYGKIDVLVNNAGIVDRFLPAGEVTDELWDYVLAVNLNGPLYTMRRALPDMVARGKGSIINISSVAGMRGAVAGAAYTASKHGLVGLTQNTAWMYAGKGIRANVICPGGVKTNITIGGDPSALGYERLGPIFNTMPRQGEASELASVILFLASDEASFVNGAVIAADGGWTAG